MQEQKQEQEQASDNVEACGVEMPAVRAPPVERTVVRAAVHVDDNAAARELSGLEVAAEHRATR